MTYYNLDRYYQGVLGQEYSKTEEFNFDCSKNGPMGVYRLSTWKKMAFYKRERMVFQPHLFKCRAIRFFGRITCFRVSAPWFTDAFDAGSQVQLDGWWKAREPGFYLLGGREQCMDSTEQRRDDTMEPTKHGGLRVILYHFLFQKYAQTSCRSVLTLCISTFTLICC